MATEFGTNDSLSDSHKLRDTGENEHKYHEVGSEEVQNVPQDDPKFATYYSGRTPNTNRGVRNEPIAAGRKYYLRTKSKILLRN